MSYDEERKRAWDKMEHDLAEVEKDYKPKPGKDDTLTYLRRPIIKAYNKALLALKEKYGVE